MMNTWVTRKRTNLYLKNYLTLTYLTPQKDIELTACAYLGAGDDNTLSKLRQVPKKQGLLVTF
jgi:hypothetical protein